MASYQIGMIIFPGMTNLDFAGPLEVFARMPDTEVHVLAKVLAPLKTDLGYMVTPTLSIGQEPPLDLIFIGGGPGINALLEDEDMLAYLARVGKQVQWVTSVCTGALVLGAAGLLIGYKAATHWTAMEVLPLLGAEPDHRRVVVDRNRVTGGGVTAGIDFGLTIAALLHGDTTAQSLQLGMEYNPEPPFPAGSPAIAPPEITNAIRREMVEVTAKRMMLAEKVARKRGWSQSD
jgi:cyclohexyl-isocyanide hydratase